MKRARVLTKDRIRYLLLLAGESQVGAARCLGLNPRTVRRWAAGQGASMMADYALRGLVAEKHGMKV